MAGRPINTNSIQTYSNANELTHSTVDIPKYDKVLPSLLEVADYETKFDDTIAAEQKMVNHGEKPIHLEPNNKSSSEIITQVKA